MLRNMNEPIIWTDNMNAVFIDCWKSKNHEIRNAKRTMHIYRELVECLKFHNIYMTASEVHTKIENLISQHRSEKLKLNPFNNTPSEWKWYNAVNEIVELCSDEYENISNDLHLDEQLDLIAQVECYLQDNEQPSTSRPCITIPDTDTPKIPICIESPTASKCRKLREIQEDLVDQIKGANETGKLYLEELRKQTSLLEKMQQYNEQQLEFARQNAEFQKSVLDYVKNKKRKKKDLDIM